jgi:hypothetical protein
MRRISRGFFVVNSSPAKRTTRRGREQADDGEAGRCLPASRLADEADRLALVQREADPSTAFTTRTPPNEK